jgi:hypothetical protein
MSSEVQAKWMNSSAPCVLRQLRLQPVLDRLDVVVGLGLDALDVLGIALGKGIQQGGEAAAGLA